MNSFEILNKEFNKLALLDEEFLIALQAQKERELYARISALNSDELPIDYLEGRIQSGNINIDGTSAIRRTCSLTMVTDDLDINDVYWGVRTKVKIEVGIKNNIQGNYGVDSSQYPDIIWFPQGIYILTSFNTSVQLTGCSISLQGKDKMAMLNGDLGGQLYASVDFGTEEVETKTFIKTKISNTNSDILISGNYYIEGVSDNNFPEEVFITSASGNMRYSFEEYLNKEDIPITDNAQDNEYTENTQGLYYRMNGFYRLIKNKDLNKKTLKKYKIYQKVTHPSQMFEYIGEGNNKDNIIGNDVEYEKGKYYYNPEDKDDDSSISYSNDDGVYMVDYGSNAAEGRSYWKLKDIYRLELNVTKTKIPLEKIIREAVHAYALEPYQNIIINDLENYGLEQLTYKGDTDLVAIQRISDGEFANLGFKDRIHYWVPINDNEALELNKSKIIIGDKEETFTVDHLINKVDLINGTSPFVFSELSPLLTEGPTLVYAKNPMNDDISTYYEKIEDTDEYILTTDKILKINKTYYVKINNTEYKEISNPAYYLAIISYGDDIGYRVTDLTYTGDLITNLGDSLTSMLDKIKDMLGEFEYFYDLNGRFVFQQKKNYVNIAWTQLVQNEDENYVTYANDTTKFSFSFEGNKLITAVQNAPQLNAVRNDFSIWGKRKTLSGDEYPIHARYAIDKKPKEYMAFNGILYYTQEAKNNPSTYYADLIQEDKSLPTAYQKNMAIIPDFLKTENGTSSDWWELMDWANYYQSKTGVFPTYQLMQYCSEGFKDILTINNKLYNFKNSGRIIIDLDMGDNLEAENNPNSWVPYTRPLKLGINTVISWNPFQHGYHGCGHTYAQYRLWYDLNPSLRSFIYKPQLPNSQVIDIDGGILNDDDSILPDKTALMVDWRELIYRMAIDYFDAQGCSEDEPIYNKDQELVISNPDHFLAKVAELNPYYYPTGQTGYEQYYTDMQGFWRQLYNPDYLPQLKWAPGQYETNIEIRPNSIYKYKQSTWQAEKPVGINVEYYICPSENVFVNKQERAYFTNEDALYADNETLYNDFYRYLIRDDKDEKYQLRYWNTKVVESPELLNFWIDFLDDVNEIAHFSIPMIGDRTMTISEDKVKAIAYKDIPGLVVVSRDSVNQNKGEEQKAMWQQAEGAVIDQIKSLSGYTFVWLPVGMSQFFTISYRSLSAKNKIEQLLYQYSYCPDNITITALPIYHLEPNTRIYVRDEKTKINGEYIISKITLPLDHKGTMSIQATKAPSRII